MSASLWGRGLVPRPHTHQKKACTIGTRLAFYSLIGSLRVRARQVFSNLAPNMTAQPVKEQITWKLTAVLKDEVYKDVELGKALKYLIAA